MNISTKGATPPPNELIQLLIQFNAGCYEEVEMQARLLVEQYPDSGVSWELLGAALEAQKKDPLHAIQKAAEFLPHDAEAQCNLGNVLRNLGRYDEALASYRRALGVKPDYAEAHCDLGATLRQVGQLDEAAGSCRRALDINPNYAEAYNNLGNSLRNLGRLESAVENFHRAIQIKPTFAEAHCNLGVARLESRQLVEAATHFRWALEIKPDYAEAHCNLGNVLRSLGRHEDAVASYCRALEIKSDFAEAHCNLGVTLLESRQLDDALASFRREFCNLGAALLESRQLEDSLASFRRALDINPGYAEAHSNMGSALMTLGKRKEAELSLNKAIELAPGDVNPLVTALFYIPYRQDDPRFSQLEKIYAQRESLLQEDRIELNFAMGKAMENIGQYDKSYKAYEEGNRLHGKEYPFDEAGIEHFVEKSCSFFTSELFKKYAALADVLPAIQDERVPIFIVGMPRSGTSLIEQILASHPAIFGGGELAALKATLLLRDSIKDWDDVLALRKLGQEYLDRVWKLAPDARYITDKLPGNYCHLGLIHLMLPNAKIIHATRDPRDTCLSCYTTRFTHGHEFSYDLKMLGRQYQRYMKLMQHWHNVLPPGRILDVRYEDNISNPEQEAKRMLDYLGLTWDPACLRFYETERAVRTASVAQVRKPIYSSSVARWKRFEKHLLPLLEIINPVQIQSAKVVP